MKVPAWMIAITDNFSSAVGEFELVHILPDVPQLFTVPKTPDYCQQVFIWQNRIIPVINLNTRFFHNNQQGKFIGIFAYQSEHTNLIEYGALFLHNTPRHIDVSDEQACRLPNELQSWATYIKCCFQDTETKTTIPILKLEHVFATQAVLTQTKTAN